MVVQVVVLVKANRRPIVTIGSQLWRTAGGGETVAGRR